ncbi:hypothetical protein P3X46_000965 [Hevea brasiliensis]|uniref:Jasmonate O-methyltransferase n=1 Tax=Hevea brasiliensis TaxID=3981 RepID=A0ABQ9NBB1_HEVBR|nr:hypothetical protein P3X46_000965 [Hevea brasiliensis]
MEVEEVLRMNGGEGETSYANNSLIQKEVMFKAKPVIEESIKNLLYHFSSFPECFRMADFGCSSGPNTLSLVWEIKHIVDTTSRKLNCKTPMSLPNFYKMLEEDKGSEFGPCFIAGMPGNFYGRLFPNNFLHFVHSSYILQWRSQVPEGLVSETGIPLNKGNIYRTKTSPTTVFKAYLNLFERDFTMFLRSQTKLDWFNLPCYAPAVEEARHVIHEEGSFTIEHLEIFEVGWDANIGKGNESDKNERGKYVAMSIIAVVEFILASHFGAEIIDGLFERFARKIEDYLQVEKGEYTSMVISMTKG